VRRTEDRALARFAKALTRWRGRECSRATRAFVVFAVDAEIKAG
jgi:hypothetical protein